MACRPLVAGNWKMNGLVASAVQLDKIIVGAAALPATVDLLVCPPFTLIASFAARAHGTRVGIGGQDCHAQSSGAHTGDISAEMLADARAIAVIVGHSERRSGYHETNADVRAKALAARRAGLLAIICVGETRAERDSGNATGVVRAQLAGSLPDEIGEFVIAYEPVWAIGTGRTATPEMAADAHRYLRELAQKRFTSERASALRILYGGSVKPDNIRGLMAQVEIDGALVGGASLDAQSFASIVNF